MPSVSCLTECVFEKPMVHSHGIYFEAETEESPQERGKEGGSSSDEVPILRRFLDHVRRKIANTSDEEQAITYEELYHACQRVRQAERGEDPVSRVFTQQLSESLSLNESSPALLEVPDSYDEVSNLEYTADHAKSLIQGVVNSELDDEDCEIKGMHMIHEVIRDSDVERVTVATLNHDRLIERFLEGGNSEGKAHLYEDGFSEVRGEVRIHVPGQIFRSDEPNRVIKPHGSVDWYLAEKEMPPPQEDKEMVYVKHSDPSDKRNYELRGGNNETYTIIGAGPFFLTGEAKGLQYGDNIIGDMTNALTTSLADSDCVIVSGFGWKDKVMSKYLINYLRWNRDNKIVFLYPNGPLKSNLYSWEDFGYLSSFLWNFHKERVKPYQIVDSINKYMKDTHWKEVKKKI
jgi:hypothetical protein